MRKYPKYIIIISFIINTLIGVSQERFSYIYFITESPADEEFVKIHLQNLFNGSFTKDQIFKTIENKSFEFGYINVSVTKIKENGDSIWFIYYGGKVYYWDVLSMSELAANANPFSNQKKMLLKFSPENIRNINEKVLTYFENNGYPFAGVYYDSISINGNMVSARLNVDPGEKIIIDTLIVGGNVNISQNYIQRVINIYPLEFYNEKELSLIPVRINNLDFIRLKKQPEISFYNNKAAVKIALIPRKSNTFDAIFGFASNQLTNKIELSGNVNLRLINSLGSGEEFKFNWQRPIAGNQSLEISYLQPYLWKSALGIQNEFSLFRRDSSFINVKNKISINYHISNDIYFSFLGQFFNSQITLIQKNTISNSAKSHDFGIGLFVDKRVNKLNPSAGYKVKFDLMAGKRTVYKISADNRNQKVGFNKAEFEFSSEFYKQIFKNNVILFEVNSSSIISKELNFNELYRLGGLKTLRGFDEQSIFSSTFLISNFEYRFLLGENSNLSVFYNLGLVDDNTGDKLNFSAYSGFGLGTLLESPVGILSLYLAIGKSPNNSILFRNAKIHFGYLIKF